MEEMFLSLGPRVKISLMLGGGTTHEFGGSRMRYHLAFGKDLRVYALERSRLLYDSAFVAPFEGELPAQTVYYVILQGTVAWRSPDERFEGPAVLRLSPSTLDGERGARMRSFCNYGDPLELVVLWVPSTSASPPPAPGVIEKHGASQSLLTAFRHYHALALTLPPVSDLRDCGRALLAACSEEGMLSSELCSAFESSWGKLAERTFEALQGAWSHRAGLPALSDLTRILGLSGSQLTRDIRSLANAIAAPGARWRKTMLDWRIRQATTLLSAPKATVTSVASEVGYGSVEAMGRAFRDAKIPSPTEIRASMLQTIAGLERG